jgi:cell division protease FtsH
MGTMAPKNKGRFRKRRKGMLGFWCTVAIVAILAAYVGLLAYSRPNVAGDRLRFDTFVDLAEKGRIKDAKVLDSDAFVVGQYIRDDKSIGQYNAPYLKAADSRARLVEVLLENRVPTTIAQQPLKDFVDKQATLLVGGLVTIVVFAYFALSYRRGTGLFSATSGARKTESKQKLATFAEVAGQDGAVTELREIVEFLAEPGRYTDLGARIPKGILLYGPPGCGKTLMARALAGEAGASFFSISGSDFAEMYVGVGAARVRDLFREAHASAPAIVFIDELDSIGRTRGAAKALASHSEQEQALNQILFEMDGFSPLEGIIVVGATNRPDVLDPALLRPGRFDRTIGLEHPDENGRAAILAVHTHGKPMASGVNLRRLAQRAIGLTGADLAGIVNEAALLAGRARRREITQGDLETALQRILEAPERQRRLSLRDRRVAHRYASGEDRVTFADVGGMDEVIDELRMVKEYLVEPARLTSAGAQIRRGILIDGPPGCGKTLAARALAGEANAAFLYVAATEFVEVFVGEGAARVRDLFAEARSIAPAIVFIDEIDAVGARRGTSGVDGNRETEQTLNQLLVELDGFSPRSAVVVIAATNRPDILDPALIRPGRFDVRVTVDVPSRDRRRQILGIHARGKPLDPDVDLDVLAALTRGFSGAALAQLVSEAMLLAARRHQSLVPMETFEEALERVVRGVAPISRVLSDDERRMAAYHESGHALVSLALKGASVPHRLSIVPMGQSLGATWSVPDDRLLRPRSALLDQLATMLGGRAAEELVFGEPGSGSADDLEIATRLSRRIVCEYGMSDRIGPRSFLQGAQDGGPGYSPETARLVDSEIDRLLTEAIDRARSVLTAARRPLDRVASALLEKEVLTAADLEKLVRVKGDVASGNGAGSRARAAKS